MFGRIPMACVMDEFAALFHADGVGVQPHGRRMFSRFPFAQLANAQLDAPACRLVTGVLLMGVRVPPHALP